MAIIFEHCDYNGVYNVLGMFPFYICKDWAVERYKHLPKIIYIVFRIGAEIHI